MPIVKIVNTDSLVNLPYSYQSAAEELLGDVDWINEDIGLCKCPGEDLHNTPTRKKDCQVRIDGAPTVICQHKSCKSETDAVSQKLRSVFGKMDKVLGKSIPRKTSSKPKEEAEKLTTQLNGRLKEIVSGKLCDTIESIPESPSKQFRRHLQLFEASETVWHGEPYDSTPENFLTSYEWQCKGHPVANYISHSVFSPSAHARSNENVIDVKFLVVESDELSKEDQLGLFGTMRNSWGWDLRLVLDTAGKSLHAWFIFPAHLSKDEIRSIFTALKCDTKLLTDSQPSRVAGAMREGKMQSIIWLGSGVVTQPKSFHEICSGNAIAPKWGQSGRPASHNEAITRRPGIILDGLLYERSKLILGAIAKAGKSYFAMKMAYCLAKGISFLKWGAVKPLKVLYVDFELHEWELDERCAAVCDYAIPENLGTITLRKHHFVRNTAALGKVLQEHAPGVDVIFLDCLYKFNEAEDENDNAAMKMIGAWMDGITAATGAAIVLIHHFGKGGGIGKDSIDRFRGASSIVGEMDAILGMEKHEDDQHFVIKTTARSFAPTEDFVAYWNYPHWELAEDKDPAKVAKPGAANQVSDDTIVKCLPVGPENAVHLNNLKTPLGVERLRKRLKELEGKGACWVYLESDGKGAAKKGYYRMV